MRVLVLGGTRFVGRAVVRDALARGWDVTAVHRGVSGASPAGATSLIADRAVPGELERVLCGGIWDLAVDTWDGAPGVATEAAQLLRDRVQRYGYVSSMSVYVWGSHVDESSPLVAGDAFASEGEYPALKRGAEIGVLGAHPDALLELSPWTWCATTSTTRVS
jgi:2'-hydroxyisoflavone reductase